MDYLRTKYLSKLEELKDKHYIKVITGIRRCGKSTLLKQFQNFLTNKYSINKKCIQMFNFNVLENAKLTYIEIYDLIIKKSIVGSINYIFLDEIQEIDKYEKILISLFENTEYKFDIYITGSNGKMLSSELATLITGRHKDIQIYPLNLNEYTEINNTLNIVKDNINFSYLRNGGLGTIIPNFGDDEFIENDMKTILFDTINNDVINRHKIRSSIMINKVIDYAYSNIGKQISALKLEKNLSIFNEFKITFKTIENYLQWAVDAMILIRVNYYNIKTKNALKTSAKYYAGDLGLLNSKTGFKMNLIGYKLENAVLLQLLENGYEVYTLDIYCQKKENKNIDFVVVKNHNIKYIQVTHTLNDENYDREVGNLLSIKDNNDKIILHVNNEEFFDRKDGVKRMNLWDFLLGKEKI